MKKLLAISLVLSLAVWVCALPAAAAAPAALSGVCSEEEWELLRETNRQRLAQGKTPLSTSAGFQAAAGDRAADLTALYSHTRPDGSPCFTALDAHGLAYSGAAENIAAGQRGAQNAVDAWMLSDQHRANLLFDDFSHVGVGYAAGGFLGTSWVQLFAGDGCSVSDIVLSTDTAACDVGTSLDDLDLYITATCPVHGECFLPLLSGMCRGFAPDTPGLQTVVVSYAGCSAALQVFVSDGTLDLSGADSWARDWLTRADELSLLSAMNRTGFTSDITRLQFADLAVRLAEQLTGRAISPAAADSFTDTADPVVLKAKAAGIASGYPSGDRFIFRPANPISRQEICVMLANMVSYVDTQRGSLSGIDRAREIRGAFPDKDQVDSWATVAVAMMTNNPVMGGKATDSGTILAPLSNTTLQEAVTLAVKLHTLLK